MNISEVKAAILWEIDCFKRNCRPGVNMLEFFKRIEDILEKVR